MTTYSYDLRDRLVGIDAPSGQTRYDYDAEGHRVQASSPAGTTRFLVDDTNATGLSQVLEERDGTGNLRARYSYGASLLSMSRAGASSFFQKDTHGSTRLLADATGSVTDTYRYDAFGSTTATTGVTENPYLYSGERSDPGTGLYHLRARTNDPGTGRFLNRDPYQGRIEAPGTLHKCVYGGTTR